MTINCCPCGTGQAYSECCEPYISGKQKAATPEQLMRSRYTAYHNHEFAYIGKTMLPPAANHFDLHELQASANTMQWTKLEVIRAKGNSVEFKAYYRSGTQIQVLHEVSQFQQINGTWYYTDGTFR